MWTQPEIQQQYVFRVPEGASDFLILATDTLVRQFIARLDSLPVQSERWIGHYVDDLVAYMADYDAWVEYTEEYLEEQGKLMMERYPAYYATSFVEALRNFACGIFLQLEAAQAWDYAGVLPYTFDNLIGTDIVLRRVDMVPDDLPCKDG